MKKPRITLIVSSLLCGGVERVVAMMANYWAAQGASVTVITFDTGTTPPFFELDHGVQHVQLEQTSPKTFAGRARRFFQRISSIRAAVLRSRPEIVIAHGEFINVLTGLACAGLPVPLILTEHSVPGNIQLSKGLAWMRNIAYFGARTLVVLNAETAEYFARWNRGKIVVIPNPITPLPPGIEIAPQSARSRSIVGMGRLSPEKGFDRLIRAFAGIPNREWSLTIWGEGPMRRELENLIGALELEERVLLPGLTPSPYQELAKGAIFVLPSRVEGFGNVLCEAMAAGCAVVSFDCPTGPRSIISHGINGLLVPEGEIDTLSETITALIEDPAKRQTLADGGRASTSAYSPEEIMKRWEDVISSAGNQPRRS